MSELKGVKRIVQIKTRQIAGFTAWAILAVFLAACGGQTGSNTATGSGDANETAAKVNGKAITMEDVDRGVKQQAQGQDTKFSPLELANARLQVLQTLIEQEVMYQKAQKENLVPTDDEVNGEINKQKVASGVSVEEFDKQMKEAGWKEPSFREYTKQRLAIEKLVDKITSRIDAPKDSEIEAFYNGNKEAFVRKRGAKLAAIVIDPSNRGQGDDTTDDESSRIKANEIAGKLKVGQDFATLARQYSEDQSKLQGGDLGDISEDEMKQTFPAPIVAQIMSESSAPGQMFATPAQGKLFILKLQERVDRDEVQTLETPGVRQKVTDALVNNRKQLLAASYQAIAMNEAKIENFLAKRVVDNPNELSGARPAAPANANTSSNTNANTVSNTSNLNAANANTPANTTASNAAKANTNAAAPKPAANK